MGYNKATGKSFKQWLSEKKAGATALKNTEDLTDEKRLKDQELEPEPVKKPAAKKAKAKKPAAKTKK